MSPEVVEGADWLADVNGDVTNRTNVDVRVDDGRNYLLTTDRRYDVITADLIQPQHAGAGKLWSVEYWELTREALAPGGVMVQWVPDRPRPDHAMIVRSFLEVFPYVTAWAGGTHARRLERADSASMPPTTSAASPSPAPVRRLAAVGMGSVDQLRSMYTAGRDELARLRRRRPAAHRRPSSPRVLEVDAKRPSTRPHPSGGRRRRRRDRALIRARVGVTRLDRGAVVAAATAAFPGVASAAGERGTGRSVVRR